MRHTPTTEDRVRLTLRPERSPVVMRQDWRDLLFLHWRVAPEWVQETLPPGLTVDTFGGDAYIGLVPFTMRNVRPVWSPPVSGLSHFHETNVRTYVHADDGEPGVWFYSLDAANPIAVAIARVLFHLPYYFAAMRLETATGGEIRCVSQRRHPGSRPDDSVVRYVPESPVRYAEPGTLDHFLCERYLLYSRKDGDRLYRGRVHHTPYPLRNAAVTDFSDRLVAAAGFPGLAAEPFAHVAYASGVSVEVFGLRPVVE